MRNGLKVWWPVGAWALVILAVTTFQVPPGTWSSAPAGADKAGHFLLYAVLGWRLASALSQAEVLSRRSVLVSAAGVVLFAALDEAHQGWLPGRDPDPMDWATDVVGAGVGLLVSGMRCRS